MKMLFGCRINFGFRGSNEHTFLEVRIIMHGTFLGGHPFEKIKYYGIDEIQDKTHIIYMHTDHDLMVLSIIVD